MLRGIYNDVVILATFAPLAESPLPSIDHTSVTPRPQTTSIVGRCGAVWRDALRQITATTSASARLHCLLYIVLLIPCIPACITICSPGRGRILTEKENSTTRGTAIIIEGALFMALLLRDLPQAVRRNTTTPIEVSFVGTVSTVALVDIVQAGWMTTT